MSNTEYSIENDPLFKQISSDKKLLIDSAAEKKIKSMSLDSVVEKDSMTIPGQKYALISIVSPQSNQRTDNLCLKIKGVFDKLEDAQKHAEMLQKMDSVFDIYVVEMYSWLLLPPDPELIEQVHVDTKLNEIISGHRESQLKSKMYFEERKQELMDNVTLENEERAKINEEEKKNTEPELIVPVGENSPVSNFENCPNSAPISTPSELLNNMSNESVSVPSKSWADKVEEEEKKK